MGHKDFLTEDEVINGTYNYLLQKGSTSQKRLISMADSKTKAHGVDLAVKLVNDQGLGNRYYIEAKGNIKSDRSHMSSKFNTNFRWAISQIILRITVDSRNYNYNYGIAVPRSEIERCKKLICKNWALKHLKIRLYGAYWENGKLTAIEYTPRNIYD